MVWIRAQETARAAADSSTVKIAMAGLDFRYNTGAFQSRGQFVYASFGNSEAYNEFNDNKPKLGSAMTGWYLEAGYDLLHGKKWDWYHLSGMSTIIPTLL